MPANTAFQRLLRSSMYAAHPPVDLDDFVTAQRRAGRAWDAIATTIQVKWMSDGPTGETLRTWYTCPHCRAELDKHEPDCPRRH